MSKVSTFKQGCDLFVEAIHAIEWDYSTRAIELVKEIVRSSPELLEKKDSDGHTLLMWAVAQGRREVAELLIENMSVEAVSITNPEHSESALCFALYHGMEDICRLLVLKMIKD